jgi:hypothetical protein
MIDQLQLGDRVRLGDGEFIVRGLSPRTVVPGRVILEDRATGEQIEVAIDEIERLASAVAPAEASQRSHMPVADLSDRAARGSRD